MTTINKDELLLAVAAVGLGYIPAIAREYGTRVGLWTNNDSAITDVTLALIDLKDARRIVQASSPNGTAMFRVMPQVGQAATVRYISDRHAATVIAVSPTGSKVTVREDKATRTDDNGTSDTQSYTYERNPDGKVHVFHLRKGRYATDGKILAIGYRSEFYDYSF